MTNTAACKRIGNIGKWPAPLFMFTVVTSF